METLYAVVFSRLFGINSSSVASSSTGLSWREWITKNREGKRREWGSHSWTETLLCSWEPRGRTNILTFRRSLSWRQFCNWKDFFMSHKRERLRVHSSRTRNHFQGRSSIEFFKPKRTASHDPFSSRIRRCLSSILSFCQWEHKSPFIQIRSSRRYCPFFFHHIFRCLEFFTSQNKEQRKDLYIPFHRKSGKLEQVMRKRKYMFGRDVLLFNFFSRFPFLVSVHFDLKLLLTTLKTCNDGEKKNNGLPN